MLYHRNTLIDLNPKNMKVLVRVDFNVPYSLNPTNLLSDLKILSTIPTIKYLLKNDCSIIVCSHFGRPNGKYVADFAVYTSRHSISAIRDKGTSI